MKEKRGMKGRKGNIDAVTSKVKKGLDLQWIKSN